LAHPDGYLLAVAEDTVNSVTIVMFGRISGSHYRVNGKPTITVVEHLVPTAVEAAAVGEVAVVLLAQL
jgi:hypothetical protein